MKQGAISSNVFLLFILLISTSALVSGIGVLSASIISAFQVLVTFAYLIIYAVRKESVEYSTVFLVLLSFLTIIVNQAPYMISGTMMIIIITSVRHDEDLDIQYVLRYSAVALSILFSGILVLGYFNILPNHDISIWRIDHLVYRRALGFTHPNSTTLSWCGISMTWMLTKVKYERLKFMILLLLTLGLYHFTYSRTSTYVIIAITATSFIYGDKIFRPVSRHVRYMSALIPVILLIVSIAVLFLPYNSRIDALLSGRILLYKQYYQLSGFSLLRDSELENSMFDNGYLQSILAKGILFAGELMAIYIVIPLWVKKNPSRISILTFSALCLIGFTETALQHFDILIPVVLGIYDSVFLPNQVNESRAISRYSRDGQTSRL